MVAAVDRLIAGFRAFRARYGVRERPFRFDLVTVSGDAADPDELTWVRHFHRVKENA